MQTATAMPCAPVPAPKPRTKQLPKAKTCKTRKSPLSTVPVAVEFDSGASANLVHAASVSTVTEVTTSAAQVATITPDATIPTAEAADPGATMVAIALVTAVAADPAVPTEAATLAVAPTETSLKAIACVVTATAAVSCTSVSPPDISREVWLDHTLYTGYAPTTRNQRKAGALTFTTECTVSSNAWDTLCKIEWDGESSPEVLTKDLFDDLYGQGYVRSRLVMNCMMFVPARRFLQHPLAEELPSG
jgi:hypothetical protein